MFILEQIFAGHLFQYTLSMQIVKTINCKKQKIPASIWVACFLTPTFFGEMRNLIKSLLVIQSKENQQLLFYCVCAQVFMSGIITKDCLFEKQSQLNIVVLSCIPDIWPQIICIVIPIFRRHFDKNKGRVLFNR